MTIENRDVRITIEHAVTQLDRIQQSIDEQRKLGQQTGELQAEFDRLSQAVRDIDLQRGLVAQLELR